MTRFYKIFSLICICFFMKGALSEERTGLYFAVYITHWSESRRTRNHIFLSHLRLTRLREPGPRIYVPRNRVAQIIPPDTGFPFRRPPIINCHMIRLYMKKYKFGLYIKLFMINLSPYCLNTWKIHYSLKTHLYSMWSPQSRTSSYEEFYLIQCKVM
jgi:hypothetical protein